MSEEFHQFFYRQAQVVLSLANAKTPEQREEVEAEYMKNLDQLAAMVNEEFGTDKVSW